MIVNHIESGLGNQMLSYCEYLALQKANPDQEIFIETILYEIPECNNVICQWNGYELERVFGIKAANIREMFSEKEWNEIIDEIRKTEFWNKNWNYPVYFTNVLAKHGMVLENTRGDFETAGWHLMTGEAATLKSRLKKTYPGYLLKRWLDQRHRSERIAGIDQRNKLFTSTEKSIFTGQRLAFKYVHNGIEVICEDILNSFKFTEVTDSKNLAMLERIHGTNSVAIHARRGDMLGNNYACYKFGYFKRAVGYIKKEVEKPVFVFFCDPGSVEWCKNNARIFGLDYSRDQVYFVDWNKGQNSYRDMQLMSECKHQIITNSSFGWWGAYLNRYPNKITCSPDYIINTTHHF